MAKKDAKLGSSIGPKGSKEQKPERSGLTKPKEPFKMSLPKNQIKLTLKTAHSAKPANQTVLEKLGMTNDDMAETKKATKRKAESDSIEGASQKKNDLELMETLKQKIKSKMEATTDKPIDKPEEESEEITADPKKGKKAGVGGRRAELLKQLKAVEDAIHRKRTKLEK